MPAKIETRSSLIFVPATVAASTPKALSRNSTPVVIDDLISTSVLVGPQSTMRRATSNVLQLYSTTPKYIYSEGLGPKRHLRTDMYGQNRVLFSLNCGSLGYNRIFLTTVFRLDHPISGTKRYHAATLTYKISLCQDNWLFINSFSCLCLQEEPWTTTWFTKTLGGCSIPSLLFILLRLPSPGHEHFSNHHNHVRGRLWSRTICHGSRNGAV